MLGGLCPLSSCLDFVFRLSANLFDNVEETWKEIFNFAIIVLTSNSTPFTLSVFKTMFWAVSM